MNTRPLATQVSPLPHVRAAYGDGGDYFPNVAPELRLAEVQKAFSDERQAGGDEFAKQYYLQNGIITARIHSYLGDDGLREFKLWARRELKSNPVPLGRTDNFGRRIRDARGAIYERKEGPVHMGGDDPDAGYARWEREKLPGETYPAFYFRVLHPPGIERRELERMRPAPVTPNPQAQPAHPGIRPADPERERRIQEQLEAQNRLKYHGRTESPPDTQVLNLQPAPTTKQPYVPPPLSPKREAIDRAVTELQELDRPNVSTAKKVLRNLVKKGIPVDDIESVEGYLEDVMSTVRSDYGDAEEYQDARQDAWDNFVSELEQLEVDDEDDDEDEDDEASPLAVPGTEITDYLHPTPGGIVVDPGLARSTPCIRVELGEGRTPLIYSKGVIGALNDEEAAAFCAEGYIEHKPSPDQLARIEALTSAAKLCAVKTADIAEGHVEAYLSCLAQDLKAKGMNV